MNYRCVKSNTTDEVIAIGRDEDQGGQNYHDIGIWEDFTFTEIPAINQDVLDWAAANEHEGSLLKVVDDTIVSKELSDM